MCPYSKHGLSDSKNYLQGKDDWRNIDRRQTQVILVAVQRVSKQQKTAKNMLRHRLKLTATTNRTFLSGQNIHGAGEGQDESAVYVIIDRVAKGQYFLNMQLHSMLLQRLKPIAATNITFSVLYFSFIFQPNKINPLKQSSSP